MSHTMTYRKLVMPADLNAANCLFGGTMMKWADEAAAMYAMCQLQTQKLVTLKVSEILFKAPVHQGDFLEFYASTEKVGSTSFTVHLEAYCKSVTKPEELRECALSCSFVFVTIDGFGKAIKHRLADEKKN